MLKKYIAVIAISMLPFHVAVRAQETAAANPTSFAFTKLGKNASMHPGWYTTLDVKFDLQPGQTLSQQEFDTAIQFVQRSIPPGIIIRGYDLSKITVSIPGEAFPASAHNMVLSVIDRLRSILKTRPDIAADSLPGYLQELAAKRKQLEAQAHAFAAINTAQGDIASLMVAKLTMLRSEQQRLEMNLSGKEARRMALTQAIKDQQSMSEHTRNADPITEELKKIVSLREDELAAKKERYAKTNGMAFSQSEMTIAIQAGEAAIAEAKIRLAERELQLNKAGKGELLDRLTDELAMVSVDVTEGQLQLRRIQAQLHDYDTRQMRAENLQKLIDTDSALANPVAPSTPLWAEIEAKLEATDLELFALKVKEIIIKPITLPAQVNGEVAPVTAPQAELP